MMTQGVPAGGHGLYGTAPSPLVASLAASPVGRASPLCVASVWPPSTWVPAAPPEPPPSVFAFEPPAPLVPAPPLPVEAPACPPAPAPPVEAPVIDAPLSVLHAHPVKIAEA